MSVPTQISPDVLGSLVPLDRLPRSDLLSLSGQTRIETQAAGRVLGAGDARKWVIYLLDGKATRVGADGRREVVKGGTRRARMPLVGGAGGALSAESTSPVRFLRLDRELLEFLLNESGSRNLDVAEIQPEDEVAANRIFNQIYHEYMSDTLVVPGIPDIAARVRRATEDAGADIAAIARIVQFDPALAARLVQVANSPLFRGQAPVDNCRSALTRLGLKATRNLVFSFCLHSVFRTNARALRERMKALWLHSSYVGALCYVLASRTPQLDADHALLAGLVHDIGVVPILTHVESNPGMMVDTAALDRAVAELRGQIGAMVPRKWRFGSDLVTAVLEAEEWARNPGPRPDYCDVVVVAQLHSFVGTPRMSHCPRLDEVAAFARLAPGELTPDLSLQVLREAREEVNGVLTMLRQ